MATARATGFCDALPARHRGGRGVPARPPARQTVLPLSIPFQRPRKESNLCWAAVTAGLIRYFFPKAVDYQDISVTQACEIVDFHETGVCINTTQFVSQALKRIDLDVEVIPSPSASPLAHPQIREMVGQHIENCAPVLLQIDVNPKNNEFHVALVAGVRRDPSTDAVSELLVLDPAFEDETYKGQAKPIWHPINNEGSIDGLNVSRLSVPRTRHA